MVFTVANFYFSLRQTVIIFSARLLLHPTPSREARDSHTQIHMCPVHKLPVALECVSEMDQN